MRERSEGSSLDSDFPTPVVTFPPVTSKVAASVSTTQIFNIFFYFLSNEFHLLIEILAIFSMILGNIIAITQTIMKRMLAYSCIGQIKYVIIGISCCGANGPSTRIGHPQRLCLLIMSGECSSMRQLLFVVMGQPFHKRHQMMNPKLEIVQQPTLWVH